MNWKEFFQPTKLQIIIISAISFILSMLIPDFEVMGGVSPPIFIRLFSGKLNIFHGILIILVGFLVFWIIIYLISRLVIFFIRLNYSKKKLIISLIISICISLIYSTTYANLYDSNRSFPGQGISFIGILIIFIISSLVLFIGMYLVYSLIEILIKKFYP